MVTIEQEVQQYTGFDFYNMDDRLNNKQRATRDRVRAFVNEDVLPNINPYWEKGEFPFEIAYKMRDLGIIGGVIPTHGAAGLDYLEMGQVMYELAKGDGSITTFYGVHSGLAMGSIAFLGDSEQQDRWLPAMARLEKIGAFALTEPKIGSNAVGIQTSATRDGDDYILNGEKRWIGNASIADIIIVFGRDQDDTFGGWVLENPSELDGVTITDIQGKIGKRSVLNADIKLENVRVPAKNRLANVTSFKHLGLVLGGGRYGVAWEAAGCAAGAFEHALQYAKDREQFGKPIAGFQLIQSKLVEMATEVTLMKTLCYRLSEIVGSFAMTEGQLSMAKYNNARKARLVTQLARETLGGNGILIENHIARLWTDAEVIYTYEGTNEINLLLVGRELTGEQAFV